MSTSVGQHPGPDRADPPSPVSADVADRTSVRHVHRRRVTPDIRRFDRVLGLLLGLAVAVFIGVRLGPSLVGSRVFLGMGLLDLFAPWSSLPTAQDLHTSLYVSDQLDWSIPALTQIHERLWAGDLAQWSNLAGGGSVARESGLWGLAGQVGVSSCRRGWLPAGRSCWKWRSRGSSPTCSSGDSPALDRGGARRSHLSTERLHHRLDELAASRRRLCHTDGLLVHRAVRPGTDAAQRRADRTGRGATPVRGLPGDRRTNPVRRGRLRSRAHLHRGGQTARAAIA